MPKLQTYEQRNHCYCTKPLSFRITDNWNTVVNLFLMAHGHPIFWRHTKQLSEYLDSYSRSTSYGLVAWLVIFSVSTCINPDHPTDWVQSNDINISQCFQNYSVHLNLFTVSMLLFIPNSNFLCIIIYINVKFWNQRGSKFFFFLRWYTWFYTWFQVGEPQLLAACPPLRKYSEWADFHFREAIRKCFKIISISKMFLKR